MTERCLEDWCWNGVYEWCEHDFVTGWKTNWKSVFDFSGRLGGGSDWFLFLEISFRGVFFKLSFLNTFSLPRSPRLKDIAGILENFCFVLFVWSHVSPINLFGLGQDSTIRAGVEEKESEKKLQWEREREKRKNARPSPNSNRKILNPFDVTHTFTHLSVQQIACFSQISRKRCGTCMLENLLTELAAANFETCNLNGKFFFCFFRRVKVFSRREDNVKN